MPWGNRCQRSRLRAFCPRGCGLACSLTSTLWTARDDGTTGVVCLTPRWNSINTANGHSHTCYARPRRCWWRNRTGMLRTAHARLSATVVSRCMVTSKPATPKPTRVEKPTGHRRTRAAPEHRREHPRPSLIRMPDWIESPLGRYYPYFADHKGRYIRLAYADDLADPWRIHPPGQPALGDTPFPNEPPDTVEFLFALLAREDEPR